MQNKWMTREEFKNKAAQGYCWIAWEDGNVYAAYFFETEFYESSISGSRVNEDLIKAVMPIEKPEYPKEVG